MKHHVIQKRIFLNFYFHVSAPINNCTHPTSISPSYSIRNPCRTSEPSFKCENLTCKDTPLTSFVQSNVKIYYSNRFIRSRIILYWTNVAQHRNAF
jgi:hypothetical protein